MVYHRVDVDGHTFVFLSARCAWRFQTLRDVLGLSSARQYFESLEVLGEAFSE